MVLPDVRQPIRRGVQHTLAELLSVFAGLLFSRMVSPGGIAVCHPPPKRRRFQVGRCAHEMLCVVVGRGLGLALCSIWNGWNKRESEVADGAPQPPQTCCMEIS